MNYTSGQCTFIHLENSGSATLWSPKLLNHFLYIDAFWNIISRRRFENMPTKEEIAQNEQFLLLSPCFQLYSIIVLSFSEIVTDFALMFSKSSAADYFVCGKRVKRNSILFSREVWQLLQNIQYVYELCHCLCKLHKLILWGVTSLCIVWYLIKSAITISDSFVISFSYPLISSIIW